MLCFSCRLILNEMKGERMPFEIVCGDPTAMRVDAAVQGSGLSGGAGIDDARGLPCRYIILTAAPVWRGGCRGEKEALASCYRQALELAGDRGCETVAFPLLGADRGFPPAEAMQTAGEAIRAFLSGQEDMRVYLALPDRTVPLLDRDLYSGLLRYLMPQPFLQEADEAPAEISCEKEALLFKPELKESAVRKTTVKARVHEKRRVSGRTDASASRPENPRAPFPAAGARYSGLHNDDEALRRFLKQRDEGFRDVLLRKIDESGMTDAECYKKANVDRKLFNKIKNQPDYRPGKTTVLAFAVALELSPEETRDLLARAGFSFSRSSTLDLIVEFFISQGRYDIFEINEALFAFDQALLGSVAAQ